MPAINKLLEEEQWDAVRSIFKAAPVNLAWEHHSLEVVKRLTQLTQDRVFDAELDHFCLPMHDSIEP